MPQFWAVAGAIAQNWGIQYTLYFAMIGQVLGILISLFFQETAPGKSKSGEASDLDRLEEAQA